VSDVPQITVTIPSLGAVSTTSSATIVVTSRFSAGTAPPDRGFHAETSISVPPAPAPILTTPLAYEHAPFDLVITAATAAAAMGAIVAWHIRRSRLDEFVQP
jgi:hypothetical protein